MFYSPSDISTSSCNAQIVSEDYFTFLREAFKFSTPKYKFYFREDKEDNSCELELQMPMDAEAKIFVSMFRAKLQKNFKHDFLQDFLTQLLEVVKYKNEIIDAQKNRIDEMNDLQIEIDTTRVEVARMREETGPALAAQFIGILNDLKTKSTKNEKPEIKEEELGGSLLDDLNQGVKRKKV